ncbi:alpha/beta hydrolase [Roseobacter denitrificans]|uniref:Hydrolase, alpha/beta fold family n=1 Tax=Roseobacter denitrificans (strain ATCC 33942 / OCh 114) TaxID=375451 RepID=Q162T5_ROSDO|nr:alpha/beta hydrolase [Roseobacter denitrificans]ABG33008.1 hydrolase, alpha/beta fold family [Roseobacter denitrificans OCh 114]AVL52388.1 alpha/beta hydrolase [Roseobacter denitrificans]SFG09617.1 Pimeloyl-ACP methyl ester carboxylesterase [Roseobacter denitrificans OCh 114]
MSAGTRRFGDGARKALAIHCSLAHSGAWRGLGQVIGEKLSLTAIDLPGHGTSPAWDRQCDLTALSLSDAAPYLTEPVDVIGHSYGSVVALLLAVSRPEMVRSLTLIEPVFFAITKVDAPDALARFMHVSKPYEAALHKGDWEDAARAFNRLWGSGVAWADIPAATRRYMTDRMHLIPAQHAAILDDSHALLAPGRLARARMPVLLIKGAQSPEIAGSIVDALAHRLPDARSVTIAGAGHMSPITHPEAVGQALLSFLKMA